MGRESEIIFKRAEGAVNIRSETQMPVTKMSYKMYFSLLNQLCGYLLEAISISALQL